jgi:hypothetical protein
MNTTPQTGITVVPRPTLSELKYDLKIAQDKLAVCRSAPRGGIKLLDAVAQRREEQALSDKVEAISQHIGKIETRGQEEARVRKALAAMDAPRHAIDTEIEEIIVAMHTDQARLEVLERQIKTLGRSRNVGELKIKEEKTMDAALNEISRLRNCVRLAGEDIADLRAKSAAFTGPEYRRLAAMITKIDEQKQLDALSYELNVAVARKAEIQKMLHEAEAYENRCRFEFQTANDAIQEREQQHFKEIQFEQANAQRRQPVVSNVPAPMAGSLRG